MPKIPQYFFQPQMGQSANVRADVGMYDGLAQAGRNVGNAVAGIGQDLMQHAIQQKQEVKRAEDAMHVNNLNLAMQAYDANFHDTLDVNSDQNKWAENYQKGFNETIAKVTPKEAGPLLKERLRVESEAFRIQGVHGVNKMAEINGIKKASDSFKAVGQMQVSRGDLAGYEKTLNDMVENKLIFKEAIPGKMQAAQQNWQTQQAALAVESDPFESKKSLQEKDANGNFTQFPDLPIQQRHTMQFRANNLANQYRNTTMQELLQKKEDALRGSGDMPSEEQVRAIAEKQGISPKWVNSYFKPQSTFDAQGYAALKTEIMSDYDPNKDTSNSQNAELMGKIYSAGLPAGAQTELLSLLKKKSDPKSEINSPAIKERYALDDADRKDFGAFLPPEIHAARDWPGTWFDRPATATQNLSPMAAIKGMKDSDAAKMFGEGTTVKMVIDAEEKNYSDYRTSLNEFIQANPNATDADLYAKSQELKSGLVAKQIAAALRGNAVANNDAAKAVGGFVVGKVYTDAKGNKATYQGGDPKSSQSWK